MDIINKEAIKYSRMKNPYRNTIINKGVLEVLDTLTHHPHEDVVNNALFLIEKLKDEF